MDSSGDKANAQNYTKTQHSYSHETKLKHHKYLIIKKFITCTLIHNKNKPVL